MTDLEITRLCAEAMGLEKNRTLGGDYYIIADDEDTLFNPLTDDAQAMALVKKLDLMLWGRPGNWYVEKELITKAAMNPDLNRAICECVANMQKAKS